IEQLSKVSRLIVHQPIDPGAVHGGAESCSFCSRQTNDWNPKDIGTDLTPDGAFAASAGQPDLGRLDTKRTKTIEPIGQSQGRTFHDTSCYICRGHIRGRQTVKYSYALREVWGALSSQIGEKNYASGSGRRLGNGAVQPGDIPAEEFPDMFSSDCHVH